MGEWLGNRQLIAKSDFEAEKKMLRQLASNSISRHYLKRLKSLLKLNIQLMSKIESIKRYLVNIEAEKLISTVGVEIRLVNSKRAIEIAGDNSHRA